jgi:hypothetical protein
MRRFHFLVLFGCFAISGTTSPAQAPTLAAVSPPTAFDSDFSSVVVGVPICADMEIKYTRTLADGNRIRETSSRRFCRDAKGRTRTEIEPARFGNGNDHSRTLIEITDPVAESSFTLDSHSRTVVIMRKWKSPTPPPPQNINTLREKLFPNPALKYSEQPLPEKTINGIAAKGMRTTETMAAGIVGNERPLVTITEEWYSPELHLMISSKKSDPRVGDEVTTTKNILRGEPDPSLFQIPEDYRILETMKPGFVTPTH